MWIACKQVHITRGRGRVWFRTVQRDPVTELTTEVVIKCIIVRGDDKRDKQVPHDYCHGDVSTAHVDEFFEALTELEGIASVAPKQRLVDIDFCNTTRS